MGAVWPLVGPDGRDRPGLKPNIHPNKMPDPDLVQSLYQASNIQRR